MPNSRPDNTQELEDIIEDLWQVAIDPKAAKVKLQALITRKQDEREREVLEQLATYHASGEKLDINSTHIIGQSVKDRLAKLRSNQKDGE